MATTRPPNRRRRLVDDVNRTLGLMVAVLVDAHRADATIPHPVTAGIDAWRDWADQLRGWADHGDGA
jgi:hypothetical protein